MFSCEVCNKEFKDNQALSKHYNANHICKFCDKQYKDKATMRNHRQNCFKKEGQNKVCTHCGKTFECKSNCKVHMVTCLKRQNEEKAIFECNLCFPSTSFANNTNLQNHLSTHEKEKLHNCTECPKSFSCQAYLSQPYKLHKKR